VLRPVEDVFKDADFPDLLVGIGEPDDAAVWRLDEERVVIVTTDFFTPVVDDPYDYGAIAAANSLSDIYAMGGEPFLALNVAALPPDLPTEISQEIMRGGAEKAREAGVVLAGGHTIQDQEPKYGLICLGLSHPDQLMTKSAAKPGDVLMLSKPLGFGTTTTAIKAQKATAEEIEEVVDWMKQLNRDAARLAKAVGVRAATDVTGFSLLGHGWEMALNSRVGLRFEWEKIPFVSGARRLAADFSFPGGTYDNLSFFGEHVRFTKDLKEEERLLLFDAQTSGGLLLAVPPEEVAALLSAAEEIAQPLWVIGEVVEGHEIEVL
jgi:selenide,water dikinase